MPVLHVLWTMASSRASGSALLWDRHARPALPYGVAPEASKDLARCIALAWPSGLAFRSTGCRFARTFGRRCRDEPSSNGSSGLTILVLVLCKKLR